MDSSKNAYHLCFLSFVAWTWKFSELEIRVSLSILFIHNSVMFSDSSKGPQTAVSWRLGFYRASMGFSQAVVFLSELLVFAIFLLL